MDRPALSVGSAELPPMLDQSPPTVLDARFGAFGAQVQVLAEEVRTYLLLHGGVLDERDEAGLDRFAEAFLLPAFAAVWTQGHSGRHGDSEASPDTGESLGPHSGRKAINPYLNPRLSRREPWWSRLLRHPDGGAGRSAKEDRLAMRLCAPRPSLLLTRLLSRR